MPASLGQPSCSQLRDESPPLPAHGLQETESECSRRWPHLAQTTQRPRSHYTILTHDAPAMDSDISYNSNLVGLQPQLVPLRTQPRHLL